jgi:hypothetical protein
MSIFIFIPAFFVFVYSLYKLVKDDYVFIRKNISSEQIFDVAFMVTWIGLFFSRTLSIILYPQADEDIFLSFFSVHINDFSLLGLILGGIGGLYLIGKHRKYPINNIIDFFTSAFVISLPVGFFSSMFFLKEYELLLHFLNGVIYAIFAYYLIRYIKHKLTVFLIFFSFISLANLLLLQFIKKINFITIESILFLSLIIISLTIFFKQK